MAGGEIVGYDGLMLAKIEHLIRFYLWSMSSPGSRGEKPTIDIPSYMIEINNKNAQKMDERDIANVYDWIYDDNFVPSDDNYN